MDMCNKDINKKPRFPARFYTSYVPYMINLSISILRLVDRANMDSIDVQNRLKYQEEAMGDCVTLDKLIYIAYKHGWISEKQFKIWQKKVCRVYWTTKSWSSK